jgi:2-succinyl-6-hydroxy-2,4-cyclohexadiene-1-carboxylate synthase
MILESAGVGINVRQWGANAGSSRGTLALHGFTGSGEDFAGLATSLGGQFAAVDFVGHGGSDSPESIEPYSMNFAVSVVFEVVKVLGWDTVDVIGYSMGGRVAVSLFSQSPIWLNSLTVVGAHAGIADDVERRQRVEQDNRLADRILKIDVDNFSDEWEKAPVLLSQSNISEPVLEGLRSRRRENVALGLANSLRGMGAGAMPPVWAELGQCEAPALFVTGSQDEKFSRLAALLTGAVQTGRHVVLDGVGHTAHLESPDEFLRLMSSVINPAK